MVRAAVRDVEASAAEAERVRRELWPDLAVGVQLGRTPGRAEMGGETMGSLMVGASVPLFARDRQLRMREEAASMRQMAAAELAAMRADTRARVAEMHAPVAST